MDAIDGRVVKHCLREMLFLCIFRPVAFQNVIAAFCKIAVRCTKSALHSGRPPVVSSNIMLSSVNVVTKLNGLEGVALSLKWSVHRSCCRNHSIGAQ